MVHKLLAFLVGFFIFQSLPQALAADEVLPETIPTSRIIDALEANVQMLDNMRLAFAHLPDQAAVDAYISAFEEMNLKTLEVLIPRADIPRQAWENYLRNEVGELWVRFGTASSIAQWLRMIEESEQIGVSSAHLWEDLRFGLGPGVDPQAYLAEILTDRPKPFELPGLSGDAILATAYPGTASPLPLAFPWPRDSRELEMSLKVSNTSDTPLATFDFDVIGTEAEFGGANPEATFDGCRVGSSVQCALEISAQDFVQIFIPYNPTGGAALPNAPYEFDVVFKFSGIATAPGELDVTLPEQTVPVRFRRCNDAFDDALKAFFQETISLPPLQWSYRQRTLPFVLPAAHLPGFMQVTPRLFDTSNQTLVRAHAIARQTSNNRGPDDRLRDLGQVLSRASFYPPMDDLRGKRYCPASVSAAATIDQRLADLDAVIQALKQDREVIKDLLAAATTERERLEQIFRGPAADAPDSEGVTELDVRREPDEAPIVDNDRWYRGINRMPAAIFRALHNSLAMAALPAARTGALGATSRVLGQVLPRLAPYGLAVTALDGVIEAAQTLAARTNMYNALGWVEAQAYLEQLLARYDGVIVELGKIGPDYVALHDRACACRFK